MGFRVCCLLWKVFSRSSLLSRCHPTGARHDTYALRVFSYSFSFERAQPPIASLRVINQSWRQLLRLLLRLFEGNLCRKVSTKENTWGCSAMMRFFFEFLKIPEWHSMLTRGDTRIHLVDLCERERSMTLDFSTVLRTIYDTLLDLR